MALLSAAVSSLLSPKPKTCCIRLPGLFLLPLLLQLLLVLLLQFQLMLLFQVLLLVLLLLLLFVLLPMLQQIGKGAKRKIRAWKASRVRLSSEKTIPEGHEQAREEEFLEDPPEPETLAVLKT